EFSRAALELRPLVLLARDPRKCPREIGPLAELIFVTAEPRIALVTLVHGHGRLVAEQMRNSVRIIFESHLVLSLPTESAAALGLVLVIRKSDRPRHDERQVDYDVVSRREVIRLGGLAFGRCHFSLLF